MNIASAVILCTIVGAVGAIILVAAAKFMAVEEDPRIEEVASCLAGANCGGCGYAGCADYAKAVVMDGVPCDKCAPGGPKAAAAIAKIMGGEASAVEKKAVVQCQGSSEHCKPAYDYKGIQTCAAAATLYGGPKTCSFACIGLGDCTKVCKFDAIHIVDGVAKVGVRLSPQGVFNDIDDPQSNDMALYLAKAFSELNIAFLHIAEPDWAGGEPLTQAFRLKLREAFIGTLITCGGYNATSAEALLGANLVDMVAFGRPFIANPDLVGRLRENAPLNEPDASTFYGGAEAGYTDYPALG